MVQKSGLFPDLKLYPDGQTVMRALTVGEIKAGVVGANLAAYEIKLGNFPNVQLVKSWQPLFRSDDAFGVRKTDGDHDQIRIRLTRLTTDTGMRMMVSSRVRSTCTPGELAYPATSPAHGCRLYDRLLADRMNAEVQIDLRVLRFSPARHLELSRFPRDCRRDTVVVSPGAVRHASYLGFIESS